MVMKPTPGMTGGYSSLKDSLRGGCTLRVEVISYEEVDDTEKIGLRVSKNLDEDSGCNYAEGEEFIYVRKKGSEDNPLESLILD